MLVTPNRKNEVEEINLLEVFRFLMRYKVLILTSSCIFAVIVFACSFFLTDQYEAEIVLYPALNGDGGIQGANGRLSAIAGFAGIRLKDENNNIEKALEVLQSRRFLSDFIRRHNLKDKLAASDKKISDMKMIQILSKRIDIDRNYKTNVIKIQFTWKNPDETADWLNWLIGDLNLYVRDVDKQDAQASINYLDEILQSTSVVEMKKMFYQLIEAQTKKLMIAESKSDYVFDIIDPAVPPIHKIYPNRIKLVLVGIVIGSAIGVVMALFKRVRPG